MHTSSAEMGSLRLFRNFTDKFICTVQFSHTSARTDQCRLTEDKNICDNTTSNSPAFLFMNDRTGDPAWFRIAFAIHRLANHLDVGVLDSDPLAPLSPSSMSKEARFGSVVYAYSSLLDSDVPEIRGIINYTMSANRQPQNTRREGEKGVIPNLFIFKAFGAC
jgi:hypothetical protein